MPQQTPVVIVESLFDDARIPARQTHESAGFDLHAHVSGRSIKRCRPGESPRAEKSPEGELVLEPGERALVPLGFRARVPSGFEAQIRIRSSTSFAKGLTMPNAPGTIDADYPDEWLVMLRNDSGITVAIEHGERIAQAIIAPYSAPDWQPGAVAISTNRTGGIGSTGRA